MRRLFIGTAVVALLAIGGYGVAVRGALNPSCSAPDGKATGSFDPVMSGVCRFSCAVQKPYEEKDLVLQPGAVTDRLTRCPVSGVVFTVADDRPRLRQAEGEYVFCCDRCVEKFRRAPGKFVRL